MELINYDSRQPYEDFGNAIIVRACDDYVDALKELKKPKPNDPKKEKSWVTKQYNALQEIRNINRFFRSRLYSFITSVDPDYIIQRLIEEHATKEIIEEVNNTPFKKERI